VEPACFNEEHAFLDIDDLYYSGIYQSADIRFIDKITELGDIAVFL
jgi:hypothetical protein